MTGDHRHGDGRADADGGHQRHHGRRRADFNFSYTYQWIRVATSVRRDGHFRGDVEHLHPGGGRLPWQDHQGQGELHATTPATDRDARTSAATDRRRWGRATPRRRQRLGPHGDHATRTRTDTFAAANFNFADTDRRRCAVEREDRDPARATGKGTLKLERVYGD